MIEASFPFEAMVAPILSEIGYDFARLRELSDEKVRTVWQAQRLVNIAMRVQLANDVGDVDVAARVLDEARRLPAREQEERRHQFEHAVERYGKAPPTLLAAHLALALDIETVLTVEIERRSQASPMI